MLQYTVVAICVHEGYTLHGVHQIEMGSWAINTLRRVANDLESFGDGRILSDAPDSFLLLLELVYREILVQEQLDGHSLSSRACTLVSRAVYSTRLLQDRYHEFMFSRQSEAPVLQSVCAGRPRFDIPEQQLQFRFTGTQMAEIIGVSLRTVRRRMTDYGLNISDQYADVTDHELEHLVMGIEMEFPTCGQKQMMGHLRARGYRVQQVRLREIMRRVDPEGSIMRRLTVLNRRRYSVPAPGSLWHIDGNHKLIR